VSYLDPFGLDAIDLSGGRSWLNMTDPVDRAIADHLDRYDYMMKQVSNAPMWTQPVNALSVVVNLAAQDLGGFIGWAERELGIPEGASAMLPMLAWESQMTRLCAANSGGNVIFDSNVISELRASPTLGGRILPGETPVVSYVTGPELRNAAAHNPRFLDSSFQRRWTRPRSPWWNWTRNFAPFWKSNRSPKRS